MLGKSLEQSRTQGSAQHPITPQGPKEQVGGSSWNADDSDDSNDNNKLWSFCVALLKRPSRSEARWGVRHSACP